MNPQTTEPETIALGDRQYTQEQLQEAVGIAEQARELEEKWNTKIDRLMPEYTKATQERADYERQVADLNAKLDAQITAKAEAGQEMTEEEQAKFVRDNAKKYGILTEDTFEEKYQARRAEEANQAMAMSLIDRTSEYLEAQAAEGKPRYEAKDVISFMDERGWEYNGKAPIWEDAYQIMARDGIDKWKTDHLSANKPEGFYTQSQSTAGAKVPEEKRVTAENLSGAINDVMGRFQ